jgi:hypothetical protein
METVIIIAIAIAHSSPPIENAKAEFRFSKPLSSIATIENTK